MKKFDRNKVVGPWKPMEPMELAEEAKAAGVLAAFRNNRGAVYVKRTESSGLMMETGLGIPAPVPVVHLIVVMSNGRSPTYRECMQIKRELVHPNSDMVEIFPDEEREINASQTHLWCLPAGYRLPLGLIPAGAVGDGASDVDAIPGIIKRSELMFYVLETPQAGKVPIVEVFANEDDAKACYDATGNSLPSGGGMRMLGMVPQEEEGAAWSPSALDRRNQLMDRIGEAGKKMAEAERAVEAQVRLPAGNPSIEDEMEAEGALGDVKDGPMEPMEAERLEMMMREGVAQRVQAREQMMTTEQRAAEAAAEAEAAADLQRMRADQLRNG